MIYIIGIIILLLVIFFFIVLFNYFKLKDFRTSIETCCDNINELLNTKHELINKLLKKIDNEKFNDKEDALFNISFEINKYLKDSKNVEFKDEIRELNVLEENLDGLKDFYNTNVINYNEIFLNKVFNKIFILLKFDVYKSFKIRKLEEYEIFKN